MKKISYLVLSFLLAVTLMVPVYAHNVTLDDEGIITMPDGDYPSGSAKVTIDESYGEYALTYQYVELNDDDYNSYMAILEEQNDYKAKDLPGDKDSQKDKENYESVIADYEKSMQDILPGYVNNNWRNSENGSLPLDTTGIDSEKHYVLWVRVTATSGELNAVYQNKVVTYKPNTANDNVSSPSTGDNTILILLAAITIGGVMFISYKKAHA